MNETTLFEELTKIEGNINIELKSLWGKNKIFITSNGGAIKSATIGEIIRISNRNNASVKLAPYGVFEIITKEEE